MCSVLRQLVERCDKLKVGREQLLLRRVKETIALTDRGVSHAHYISNLCTKITQKDTRT